MPIHALCSQIRNPAPPPCEKQQLRGGPLRMRKIIMTAEMILCVSRKNREDVIQSR